MADRWAVVDCLRRGLPYREIHQQTGVSLTTIGRVADTWLRATAATRWPRSASMERSMDNPARIKLAVQKSGRLTDPSLDLLTRCGLKLSRGKDQLMGFGENMPLDVLFVRDDDIPDLVQEDVCDLGLVGRNVIEEKRLELAARGTPARFEAAADTGFRSLPAVHWRCPWSSPTTGCRSLQGKRIATTYPFLLARFLAEHGIAAEIVTLSGAVEIAPRLGRADLICDLVSTGSTLQANHLREVETVLESHAVLIRTPVALAPEKHEWVERHAAADRGRGAGQGEQVHHAARAALGAAGHPRCCCPAANRRPSFRLKAPRTASRCMRCAARMCSGRHSRA